MGGGNCGIAVEPNITLFHMLSETNEVDYANTYVKAKPSLAF
jgi:hypothetical protein